MTETVTDATIEVAPKRAVRKTAAKPAESRKPELMEPVFYVENGTEYVGVVTAVHDPDTVNLFAFDDQEGRCRARRHVKRGGKDGKPYSDRFWLPVSELAG